jgi:hypothetical protein
MKRIAASRTSSATCSKTRRDLAAWLRFGPIGAFGSSRAGGGAQVSEHRYQILAVRPLEVVSALKYGHVLLKIPLMYTSKRTQKIA